MIYHLTFVEFCLTVAISNQFDIMKSCKFTLIRWSNHFHYSGGSTCDGSSGLSCLLTGKVGGIGIVQVGSYKAFNELSLLGLTPSTSTKWCDVAEFFSYLSFITILLHKNNNYPRQNRKTTHCSYPLGLSWLLVWDVRERRYMLPSTSNGLINMKSTSGMLCARMFTATSVWRKCLWKCVLLWVLHNSFAKIVQDLTVPNDKRSHAPTAIWERHGFNMWSNFKCPTALKIK